MMPIIIKFTIAIKLGALVENFSVRAGDPLENSLTSLLMRAAWHCTQQDGCLAARSSWVQILTRSLSQWRNSSFHPQSKNKTVGLLEIMCVVVCPVYICVTLSCPGDPSRVYPAYVPILGPTGYRQQMNGLLMN